MVNCVPREWEWCAVTAGSRSGVLCYRECEWCAVSAGSGIGGLCPQGVGLVGCVRREWEW